MRQTLIIVTHSITARMVVLVLKEWVTLYLATAQKDSQEMCVKLMRIQPLKTTNQVRIAKSLIQFWIIASVTGSSSDDRAAAIGIGVAVTFLLSIIIGVTIGVVLTWCVIRQRSSKSFDITVEVNPAADVSHTDIEMGTVAASNPS